MTHRILQFTDTHLRPGVEPVSPPTTFSDAVHHLTGQTTDGRAESVIVAAGSQVEDLDLVIHTGDMADVPTDDAYRAGLRLLQKLGAPLLVTAGNHDSPEHLARVFGDCAATTTAFHDLDRWRIVLASSVDPDSDGGLLSAQTLSELDDVLDCEKHVVLGMHHPPLSPCPNLECLTANAWELLELIDRHANVAAVVSGHLHHADEIARAGVRFLLTPSTALQLRHLHPLPLNNNLVTQSGARLLELHDDGSLDTSLIWI